MHVDACVFAYVIWCTPECMYELKQGKSQYHAFGFGGQCFQPDLDSNSGLEVTALRVVGALMVVSKSRDPCQ